MLARRGHREGELGLAFVGFGPEPGAEAEHLGMDEATDVLSFLLDGLDGAAGGPAACAGDVVIGPQVIGDAWRGRSCTASCTCSATSTARRWKTRGQALL